MSSLKIDFFGIKMMAYLILLYFTFLKLQTLLRL